MVMFVRVPKPVRGGFLRSGMGTRLWVVVNFIPHPTKDRQFLCEVLPGGHINKGVWYEPGNTQIDAYGYRNTKWVATGEYVRPVESVHPPQMPTMVARYVQLALTPYLPIKE